ncbi:MAG: hypothetical protein PHW34_10820 [Hespellia sp.]|nr:hypothetical protein [Hespellia sp.]
MVQTKKRNKKNVFRYIFTYLCGILIVVPIAYMILSAFKNPSEVNKIVSLPSGFYLENFKTVFQNSIAIKSFVNSIIISGATIMIDIILCSLAAYGIGRRKEKIFSFLL